MTELRSKSFPSFVYMPKSWWRSVMMSENLLVRNSSAICRFAERRYHEERSARKKVSKFRDVERKSKRQDEDASNVAKRMRRGLYFSYFSTSKERARDDQFAMSLCSVEGKREPRSLSSPKRGTLNV